MTTWWKNAVVYQVYPRSFADADGDGVGDLCGITAKLDYLSDLGVDVVWLSPVCRSPMADNGYDISDYTDIDPLFGTLADLDALIAGLHARGMKLVMDMVLNHTSDQHPWFVESRDPSSAKRDWYFWRPARPGCEPGTPGAEPTNWAAFFGGRGWQYDPASGEYYLHLFAPQQPDLNWDNPDVRQALHAMMRGWVARGVDGFRFDVLNLVSKTLPLADGPAAPDGLCYDPGLVMDGPRVHEFIAELNREVGIGEHDLFSVAEMVLVDIASAREYTDPSRHEVGMVISFEHLGLDQDPAGLKWDLRPFRMIDLKRVLASWQDGLAGVGWNCLYLESHDQPRSVSRFGDDSDEFRVASAKTLATTVQLLQGTPFVYEGQELGMTNAGFTALDQYRDVESLNFAAAALAGGLDEPVVLAALAAKSRDNARTPMCWDASPNAGFTSGTPWLQVNANADRVNAAASVADPGSVYHHYRKLFALRHELPVVTDGTFELLLPDDERLFAYTRTCPDAQLLVVANWTSGEVPWPSGLPDVDGAALLLGTHPEATGALAGWESRVYRLR